MSIVRTFDRALRRTADTPAITPCLLAIILLGAAAGAVLGARLLPSADGCLQALYTALKLPLLVLASTALCLGPCLVMQTCLGLGPTTRHMLRAFICAQVAFAGALAALAPLIALAYLSGASYHAAHALAALAFAIAAMGAQVVLLRHVRPLLRVARRHMVLVMLWSTLHPFVGIQVGWMLRPFIGHPDVPAAFLRADAFSNAYVATWKLARRVLSGGVQGPEGSPSIHPAERLVAAPLVAVAFIQRPPQAGGGAVDQGLGEQGPVGIRPGADESLGALGAGFVVEQRVHGGGVLVLFRGGRQGGGCAAINRRGLPGRVFRRRRRR